MAAGGAYLVCPICTGYTRLLDGLDWCRTCTRSWTIAELVRLDMPCGILITITVRDRVPWTKPGGFAWVSLVLEGTIADFRDPRLVSRLRKEFPVIAVADVVITGRSWGDYRSKLETIDFEPSSEML